MKKVLTVLLTVLIVLTCTSVSVFADNKKEDRDKYNIFFRHGDNKHEAKDNFFDFDNFDYFIGAKKLTKQNWKDVVEEYAEAMYKGHEFVEPEYKTKSCGAVFICTPGFAKAKGLKAVGGIAELVTGSIFKFADKVIDGFEELIKASVEKQYGWFKLVNGKWEKHDCHDCGCDEIEEKVEILIDIVKEAKNCKENVVKFYDGSQDFVAGTLSRTLLGKATLAAGVDKLTADQMPANPTKPALVTAVSNFKFLGWFTRKLTTLKEYKIGDPIYSYTPFNFETDSARDENGNAIELYAGWCKVETGIAGLDYKPNLEDENILSKFAAINLGYGRIRVDLAIKQPNADVVRAIMSEIYANKYRELTARDVDVTKSFCFITYDGKETLEGESGIRELDKEIEITIDLTEAEVKAISALSKTEKQHIRVFTKHDGVVKGIDAKVDLTDKTLKFYSKEFSTFVLAYVSDNPAPTPTPSPTPATPIAYKVPNTCAD